MKRQSQSEIGSAGSVQAFLFDCTPYLVSVTIDFHTHIFPDDVARRTIAAVKKNFNIIAPESGTEMGLRASMHSAGIAKSVVLPAARLPEEIRQTNEWILSIARDGLIPFGAIHPLLEDLTEELDRLSLKRIPGVKIIPSLQKIFPDDPRCGPLYESIIERDMIIVFHAGGEPIERGLIYGTPQRFSTITESYPELKMVLTHLGGLRMWEDVQRYLIPPGKNVFFDTAYVSAYLSKEEIANLIIEIGTNHVLFGTDYPWTSPAEEIKLIRGLGLFEKEIEKILSKNGEMLLRSSESKPNTSNGGEIP